MSRRKKGRITVQNQPTGAGKVIFRLHGLVAVIFGAVFVIVALTQIMPIMPLFSLPFLAMGGFAVVMGVMTLLGKNGVPQRVAYDVESDIEGEVIAGIMEDVDKKAAPSSPAPETHDHIPSTALDARGRLEQLETLRSAGLITDGEYARKRSDILEKL